MLNIAPYAPRGFRCGSAPAAHNLPLVFVQRGCQLTQGFATQEAQRCLFRDLTVGVTQLGQRRSRLHRHRRATLGYTGGGSGRFFPPIVRFGVSTQVVTAMGTREAGRGLVACVCTLVVVVVWFRSCCQPESASRFRRLDVGSQGNLPSPTADDSNYMSFSAPVPDDPWADNALVFAVWSTPAISWTLRHTLCLDSVLLHSPGARVVILATELPTDFFSHYVRAGYSVEVIRVNRDTLINNGWYVGDATRAWLDGWDKHSLGQHFYSHLSDYLRFVLLFHYGGTYLDMDAIVTGPFPEREFVGEDESGIPDCAFCLPDDLGSDGSSVYLAPGVMRLRKHRGLVYSILESSFGRLYDRDCWSCVGPEPLSLSFRQLTAEEANHIVRLPRTANYLLGWRDAAGLFMPSAVSSAESSLVQWSVNSLHLFGHSTTHSSVAASSLAGQLLSRQLLGWQALDAMSVQLAAPTVYIHDALTKQGRFTRADRIFLRSVGGLASKVSAFKVDVSAVLGKVSCASDGAAASSCSHVLATPAAVNRALSSLMYAASSSIMDDTLTVSVELAGLDRTLSSEVQVVALQSVVTVAALGANDGTALRDVASRQCAGCSYIDIVRQPSGAFVVVSGTSSRVEARDLGTARTAVLNAVATPFVFLVSPGVQGDSALLLHALLQQLLDHRMDVVGSMPLRGDNHHADVDLPAVMRWTSSSSIALLPPGTSTGGGCVRADRLGSAFLARTDVVRKLNCPLYSCCVFPHMCRRMPQAQSRGTQ